MHHSGSPLTSGRTILWRTIPVLFLSPIISTFISGHDLLIYLPVSYGFLFLLLIQYRWLCHEWSSWTHKIPNITEDDIVSWHTSKLDVTEDVTDDNGESRPTAAPELVKKAAIEALRLSVQAFNKDLFQGSLRSSDQLVSRVAMGMPYIEWLLKKNAETAEKAEPFSLPWFAQLNQGIKSQQQMSQGLKEHNIFMLFRYARFDVGQNVGLFLIALMDRWVSVTMSAESQPIDLFISHRAKYGICFAILYFCASVMTLDGTLQKYWKELFELSDEKLTDYEHAKSVTSSWEKRRRLKYLAALFELLRRLIFIFGGSTLFVWILVDDVNILILYYAYVVGYSAVMIFQVNLPRSLLAIQNALIM